MTPEIIKERNLIVAFQSLIDKQWKEGAKPEDATLAVQWLLEYIDNKEISDYYEAIDKVCGHEYND